MYPHKLHTNVPSLVLVKSYPEGRNSMKHSFHNIYFPDKSKLVKGVSSVILIMGAMLVCSKGIAGPAVLVTHLA